MCLFVAKLLGLVTPKSCWIPRRKAPFVHIPPIGETPDTTCTNGTNRVDISAVYDPRTHNFVLTFPEDNLMRGASGQAVQIMNLWCGFDETAGLV